MHAYHLLHSDAPLDLMCKSVQQNGGISGEGEHKVGGFGGLWMIQHPLNLMSRGILFSPMSRNSEGQAKKQQQQSADTARLQWPQYKTMNIMRSCFTNHHSKTSVYFKVFCKKGDYYYFNFYNFLAVQMPRAPFPGSTPPS